MFRIYHSNKLEVLKEILVHILKQDPLSNPFEQEHILVQSPGMAQWLKMALANAIGISANIKFPLPASFIWQIFVDVLDDVPQKSAFNKDAMAWQIINRLPLFLDDQRFSPLKQYLQNDEPLKLYQLAYKIADLYDQYLVYRPQWIQAWQSGSLDYSGDQPWQAILWHDLTLNIAATGQSHFHRANLYQHLIDALKKCDQKQRAKLPKRIFIFGISALPPKYLEAIEVISAHCDIHYFQTNPCHVYWGDIIDQKWLAKIEGKKRQSLSQVISDNNLSLADSASPLIAEQSSELFSEQGELLVGNPLLSSMGKLGRDNLALMVQLNAIEIEAFASSEVDSTGYTNLLGQLADDILALEDNSLIASTPAQLSQGYLRKPIKQSDNSITIHNCHSPMREIEVLHDQLLAMLAENPALTPKDIVVMMPDVNSYAPFIQAVFGASKQRIAFSISDQSSQLENPVLVSFLQLLELPNTRQTSSELYALLEVPAIMEQFELSADDLKSLKLWIDESGICHGLAEQSQTNSWQFGLNRMIKGYAQVEGAQSELWQGILAYDESCGLAAEKLGQLAHFVELIAQYKSHLTGQRPIAQWQELIDNLLNDFYLSSLENELALSSIKECLVELNQELVRANYTHDIDSEVIIAHLKAHIHSSSSSQRFLAGKLNFCTLMPMRSIPFKVVCILGLNDGVYPRSVTPVSFDLMANDHQRGDRSRRDDDRYLFLEALLSAQNKLYLSYCGRDIKDNSLRCPSVLLNELTDYIGQTFRLEQDNELSLLQCQVRIIQHMTTQHPLTPFNLQYFTQNEQGLFSYQAQWARALETNEAPCDFLLNPLGLIHGHDQVELEQLKRFFKQPCRYFLNQRLGIYFNQVENELNDSEPFDPDALQGYLIKSRLLDSYLTRNETQTTQRLRAQGILPHGCFADMYLDVASQPMTLLADNIMPHLDKPLDDIQINLSISPDLSFVTDNLKDNALLNQRFGVVGWLKQHVRPGVLIRYKSGKANGKFFVDCYLDYLCYCTKNHGVVGDVLMFTEDGAWRFKPLEQAKAQQHLARMLAIFFQGQTQPLPFYLSSGWRYIASLFDKKAWQLSSDVNIIERAEKELAKGIEGDGFYSGESEDMYNKRCFNQVLATDKQRVIEYSQQILLPIFIQLEELGNE